MEVFKFLPNEPQLSRFQMAAERLKGRYHMRPLAPERIDRALHVAGVAMTAARGQYLNPPSALLLREAFRLIEQDLQAPSPL